MLTRLQFTVNDSVVSLECEPGETLLTVLRQRLGLKGTRAGCKSGECGSCTVLMNGKTVNSCMVLALEAHGAEIWTIEGMNRDPLFQRLQAAFMQHGAVQCGYCTSGMLISARQLLREKPSPTREETRTALSGNLCRCTGYKKIIDAVETVAGNLTRVPLQDGPNIGTSFPRADAVEYVSGAAVYVDDIERPGMVYGRVLRSAHAHARILNIDTSAAEEAEGVLAVVTGADVPEGYFGVDLKDQLVMARDKVRYRGDAVALVAARTVSQAEHALQLIKVDYEILPAVFTAEDAMKPDAPIIHEKLQDYEIGFKTERYGNVCTVAEVDYGDTEKGFRESDFVLEEEYSTASHHQVSLEPHGAIAEVDCYGKVTVWSSTQKPFAMRRYLSHGLKMPISSIRVIAERVGGGFGGKLELNVEPYAVLLAQKCGRPVKIIYSRAEEFVSTGGRHSTSYTIKTGVKKDGTIQARRITFKYDTGAFSGNGPTTTTLVCQVSTGLYRVPNMHIDGYCVYTNKNNFGSFRGPSAPQTTFVIESHTDNLARALNLDPLEFRMRNLLQAGERTGLGQLLENIDYRQTLQAVAERAGWSELKKETAGLQHEGVGMGIVFWLSGGWAASADVRINEDGTVFVYTGATEMGTGYLYTTIPQIAAEELGLRPNQIEVVRGDTSTASYDHGIGGSRGAYTVGMAVQIAARKAKEKLLAAAARKLNVDPRDLEAIEGLVRHREHPVLQLTFGQISMDEHMLYGGPIVGHAEILPQLKEIDQSRVKGLSFTAFPGNTIACHITRVKVDEESGSLQIKKYVAGHDVGRAVNPMAIEGQIEGGVAMGLGFALMEEMQFDASGRIVNANLSDYKLPTSMDVPEIEPVIIEHPEKERLHGIKGLGEPTMAPVAAAVANAIYDAEGIRIRSTPMTREKLFHALQQDSKVTNSNKNAGI